MYDADGVIQNFEIINKTQNILVQTDENGFFQISANIGDRIIFNSITYQRYDLIVSEEHLQDRVVIELRTDVNNLDEVNLIKMREFDPVILNKDFTAMLENDRKEHPYLYQEPNAQGNLMNLVSFILGKIIKKKDAPEVIPKLTYNDFQILFSTDPLLNDSFLHGELHIPKGLKNFYLDYLDSLSWSSELLHQDNRLELFQKLYDSSKDYLLLLEEENSLLRKKGT